MVEKSRIKFNPETKEIEIEGTEAFVNKYFDAIQNMITGSYSFEKSVRRTAKNKESIARKGDGKSTNTSLVLGLIRESKGGITTPELKKKTGLADKQIWPIIYKAEKQGKIKKADRGVYIAQIR
jgi:uncharacterized membrane protein